MIMKNNHKKTSANGGKNVNHVNNMSEFDSMDDFTQAFYQMALEQSIQSFKKILLNLKNKTLDT